MATDPAHDATDEEIRRLSKRLHAAYSRAYMEMAERAKADLERQADEDAEMAARVKAGEMTAEQLASWRRGRAADATWYAQMVDQLARQMAECDRQAAAIVNGASPAVYAENANYGAFQVEEAAKVDTSWTLVDADTVAGLVRDHPDLLPQVSPKPDEAERWARRKITSAITQSVLVGDSVPATARRLRSVVDMGERAATRAARTALTGAENAGRVSSYDRARGMGIDVRARWMATLDSRTRDSHRQLDGEVAGDDGRFSNGLRYPGDPTGPASEVWNCRCTLVASVPGYDAFEDRNASKLETSYEDWKAGRDPKRQRSADRTMADFFAMPGTIAKLNASGVSMAEARRRLTEQLGEYGISSGSFRKMSAGDQQRALDAALARAGVPSGIQARVEGGEAMSANAVRGLLGRSVRLGAERGKGASDYVDMSGLGAEDRLTVRRAVAYVPTRMLRAIGGTGLKVTADHETDRSAYLPGSNEVVLGKGADELHVVHELMHAVEEHDPEAMEAERVYFEERTRGKELKQLSEITGDAAYAPDELAFDVGKECIDPYAFKDYGGEAYELLSLGIEMLYREPLKYVHDPDMLKWLLDVIAR